jgi:hypothetical protein
MEEKNNSFIQKAWSPDIRTSKIQMYVVLVSIILTFLKQSFRLFLYCILKWEPIVVVRNRKHKAEP